MCILHCWEAAASYRVSSGIGFIHQHIQDYELNTQDELRERERERKASDKDKLACLDDLRMLNKRTRLETVTIAKHCVLLISSWFPHQNRNNRTTEERQTGRQRQEKQAPGLTCVAFVMMPASGE